MKLAIVNVSSMYTLYCSTPVKIIVAFIRMQRCYELIVIISVSVYISDELLQNKKEVLIGGLGAVINDNNVKVVYWSYK